MLAQDELARSDLKFKRLAERSRELDQYQAALNHRSTKKRSFPFNPTVDVLDSTLEAVAGLCEVALPPDLGYHSDPRVVAEYVIQAILTFGDKRYALGRKDAQKDKPALTRDDMMQLEALHTQIGEVLRQQR